MAVKNWWLDAADQANGFKRMEEKQINKKEETNPTQLGTPFTSGTPDVSDNWGANPIPLIEEHFDAQEFADYLDELPKDLDDDAAKLWEDL